MPSDYQTPVLRWLGALGRIIGIDVGCNPPAPPPHRVGALPPSQDRTVVQAGTSGMIVDSTGHKWTITSTGQVAIDGVPDALTSHVSQIVYVNRQVWHQNTARLWWWKTAFNGKWLPTAGTSISPLLPIPPGQITNLQAVAQTNAISLTWSPPQIGTPPIFYTVMVREHGQHVWNVGAASTAPNAVVRNLKTKTSYDIEVMAYNN